MSAARASSPALIDSGAAGWFLYFHQPCLKDPGYPKYLSCKGDVYTAYSGAFTTHPQDKHLLSHMYHFLMSNSLSYWSDFTEFLNLTGTAFGFLLASIFLKNSDLRKIMPHFPSSVLAIPSIYFGLSLLL